MSNPVVPSRHDGVSYLYMLAAFVVVVAGMRAAERILNPLLLAVFLSVICAPAYLALLRRGLSQWLSLLIVTGGLAVMAAVLTTVMMDSITRFTSRQEHYRAKIPERQEELTRLFESWLPEKKPPVVTPAKPDEAEAEATESEDEPAQDEVLTEETNGADSAATFDAIVTTETEPPAADSEGNADVWEDALDGDALSVPPPVVEEPRPLMDYIYDQFSPGTAISLAARVASSLSSLLSNALLIMLTVIFILLEVGSFEGKLKRAFAREDSSTQQAEEQAEQMVHSVQRYMAIKTIVSIATAILIGLWLRLFGVPYLSLWMLLAFLLNFIPNIGSIIAAVPAVLIAWLEFGIAPALGCSVGYIIVNVAVGNFLEPRLMGRDLGLSPLVIFCSMIFWGWVLGPIGMLLSVPLTMAVHIVLNGFDDTRWIATLMGGRVAE